ncbi:MAG: MFS transporter [Deltaproteobacteria bacterium]|nr:MFS transporter [Deltaproteobacteria bacterium]
MTSKIPYRWITAFILFFAYSIQYMDRVKTNVLMPAIAHDIGLTTQDIGTGAFLMMLFYAPAQYISGILTDKYGAKRILIFSIICWSLMTAWMGLIESPTEYFYRMALFGVLVGTEYVPSARILMRWFNRSGRAQAQALLSWAWIMTPAWASILATQLSIYLGSWRMVFYFTAMMGIVPLIMVSLYIFDRPEKYKRITQEELEYAYSDELEEGTLKAGNFTDVQNTILAKKKFGFFDLFKNRSYVAVIVVDIVMQITLWGAMVWIPVYLSDTFSFKLTTMGNWNALYFLAGVVGSFSSSYISDTFFRNRRRIMIQVCFLGLIPFVILLSSLKEANPAQLAIALCGMGFFANMAWGPFLAVPAEIFTPEVYGKAMGFVNGVGYAFAAFAAKIFAALVVVEHGTKNYAMGWIFIAICAVSGVIASFFIKTYAPVHSTGQVGQSNG